MDLQRSGQRTDVKGWVGVAMCDGTRVDIGQGAWTGSVANWRVEPEKSGRVKEDGLVPMVGGMAEGSVHTGDFTGISSAYRPDPTIGSGLTLDNKGTRFLCLVLTNRSSKKLEARGDSK